MSSRALRIPGGMLAVSLGASLVFGCTPHRAAPELSIAIDDDFDAEMSRGARTSTPGLAPEPVVTAWARPSTDDPSFGQPAFPAAFSGPSDSPSNSRPRPPVICEYKACVDATDSTEHCGYRPCGQPFPVRARLPDAIGRHQVPDRASEIMSVDRTRARRRGREPRRP